MADRGQPPENGEAGSRQPGHFNFWSRPITPESRKAYIYADETGQDTAGCLFVVAVIMVDGSQRDDLEARFLKLEARVRAGPKKWPRTALKRRRELCLALPGLEEFGARFAWAAWNTGTSYEARRAEAVALAAARCCPGARVKPIIDALKPSEVPAVADALRRHQVLFRRIGIGCRDEAYPLLRLADTAAGFLRDVQDRLPYAVEVWPGLQHLFVRV